MAYGTMRQAYRTWQASHRRLEAARRELNHQYMALLQKTEACQLSTNGGLLRTAAAILHHPFDSSTLHLRERLSNAFAILEKGFFRRCPTTLHLDIVRYVDSIKAICRRLDLLGARLRLAHKILSNLPHVQHISKQYFNLALINPEAVWVSVLLQQRRLLTRQTIDLALTQSWQTRMLLCREWFKLLQPVLPPQSVQDLQHRLQELDVQTAGRPQPGPWSLADQRRLDNFTDLVQRLVSEIISSPPDIFQSLTFS